MVEDHETEEDSDLKPDGEKETESSAQEDMAMSGDFGMADQLLGYIVQFTNAVELYQKKICNCFECGSPDHLVKDCLKDLGKTARKVGLSLKEGMAKKGGWSPLQKVVATQQAHLGDTPQSIRTCLGNLPSWTQIHSHVGVVPENIAWAKINDEGSWALLDSGSTINAVTPEFVKVHSLDMSPLSNLVDGTLKINGFGGLFFPTLGLMSS